jgi:Arc/MetJ-type ribon-helix-helix transcriptional regulator
VQNILGVVQKKRVEVTMANPYLEGMELLIKDGLYESQAEIVKDALRRLFVHYEIQLITDITLDS